MPVSEGAHAASHTSEIDCNDRVTGIAIGPETGHSIGIGIAISIQVFDVVLTLEPGQAQLNRCR